MVDVSLVSEAVWCEARRRAEVIRPLAEHAPRPQHLVQAAAATLGLSERQTYMLLRRCREAGGDLTALLPGTTFSDISQRGRYDSDKAACLTLEELERWLAIAIAKFYRLRPHDGLDGQTPLRRWQALPAWPLQAARSRCCGAACSATGSPSIISPISAPPCGSGSSRATDQVRCGSAVIRAISVACLSSTRWMTLS